MSEIPHGTRRGYDLGCRQACCREARRVYENARRRKHLYGRPPLVPAAPVRVHVHRLVTNGIPVRRVASLAGVGESTVRRLLDGHRGQPLRSLHPQTAQRLMAVTSKSGLGDRNRVDATGTRRRLQALAALGWSHAALADRMGVERRNLPRLLREDRTVLMATARRVGRVYDELCWSFPPADTPRQKQSVTRAKTNAARRGWAPPLSWDEDTIDDPAAVPDLGEPVSIRRVEPEAVEWLRSFGMSDALIAQRLGVAPQSIVTAMRRHEEAAA